MPNKIVVPDGMKWCGKCQQALDAASFHPKDGYCKTCRLEYARKRTGQTPREILPDDVLRCSLCKEIKPLDAFARGCADRNKGRHSQCKVCVSARCRTPEYRAKRNPIAKEYQRKRRGPFIREYNFPAHEMKSTDLAYIAGFVDAEGSFTMARSNLAPRLSIYNDNHKILEHIQGIIGGSILSHSRRGGVEHALVFTNFEFTRKVCEAWLHKKATQSNSRQSPPRQRNGLTSPDTWTATAHLE